MKTKFAPVGVAADAGKELRPIDAALAKLLGAAGVPLAKVIAWLRAAHPAVTIDERFPAQPGWHRIYLLKQRRLFYLTPKPGDFRFALILGDRAIERVQRGPLADEMQGLLRDARRYGEGTAFIFAAKPFNPTLVIALLEAKLAR